MLSPEGKLPPLIQRTPRCRLSSSPASGRYTRCDVTSYAAQLLVHHYLQVIDWPHDRLVARGSFCDNHCQGRSVYGWCNGRSAFLEHRHRQTLDTPAFGRRWRTEAVGYLDLGPVIFLPLAKRDRLHGQPDELLTLPKRFGRIFFDPGQAPPER